MSLSVDVVITTHQGWALTERCLDHLRRQTVEHTVIVSDGASTDGTPENIRADYPDVVLIRSSIDPGYVAATNRGVAAGEGDVVVLLNNDAYCRADFLEHVIASFERDDRVGSVAPLTVRPDEQTIDSVGMALDVTLAGFVRLTGEPLERAGAARPRVASPCGGADAYRRAAWIEAGGLDERFSFYGADTDLALRLHVLGWKTAAAVKAVAVHLRSETSGRRSRRSRESGGWARGFTLRRWGVLRSRVAVRAIVTETIVTIADTVLSRDTVAVRSRVKGWRAAGGITRGNLPAGLVDAEIGFIESLRLRWSDR